MHDGYGWKAYLMGIATGIGIMTIGICIRLLMR